MTSKFASQAPASKSKSVPTTNLAGGKAFQQDAKTELVSHMVTSMVDDTYYRSGADGINRIQALIEALSAHGAAKFVAQTAIVARSQFYLRSVTHLAAGLLGPHARGSAWKRRFYKEIVQRPDDAVEILAVYLAVHGKPIPNAMKRGLGDAISEMDEYKLAKYKGGKGKLKMIDVVNLVRPKPTPAIKALMEGTLNPAETWEVGLSEAGDDAEKKAAVWTRLISEDKLGYMACLRNLRNISQQCPDMLDTVLAKIADPVQVGYSKQLPFRFWSAMKIAKSEDLGSKVIRALDTALAGSCANVPNLSGKTLVAIDFSGSMSSPVSGKWSTVSCREIATLLGVVLAQHNDSDFCYFGDDAKFHTLHPTDSVMGQMDTISHFNSYGGNYRHTHVGHGTDVGQVLKEARQSYDRILVFSDLQSWRHSGNELANYKSRTGANPFIYSVDLRGHGHALFNPGDSKVFQLAGFSDKIFDLIGMSEMGVNALIENVESIEI